MVVVPGCVVDAFALMVVVVDLCTVVVVLVATVVVVPVVPVVLVVPVVVVVPVVAARHVGTVIVLSSRVTAPFRARARPCRVAPVLRVIDVNASMVPEKLLVVPSVAELPTCQNTLHAWAPFSRTTVLPDAVISDDPA